MPDYITNRRGRILAESNDGGHQETPDPKGPNFEPGPSMSTGGPAPDRARESSK